MTDTPLTDAAISRHHYFEKRGEWYGDEEFLYVDPGDARAIERELREEIARLQALLEERAT